MQLNATPPGGIPRPPVAPPLASAPPVAGAPGADPFWTSMQRHDLKSLDLLAVFHRIAAGYFGLVGLLALPATLLFGHLRGTSETGEVAPLITAYFTLFGGFALAIVFLHLVLGIVFWISAGWLKARRYHAIPIVLEVFLLLILPHGTALGIFGLIILLKPHVRAAFTS